MGDRHTGLEHLPIRNLKLFKASKSVPHDEILPTPVPAKSFNVFTDRHRSDDPHKSSNLIVQDPRSARLYLFSDEQNMYNRVVLVCIHTR